jgi:hypothetical protein
MPRDFHYNDIDIRVDHGWFAILERLVDEINAADVKVVGMVADEDQGRLRIDYASAEPWPVAAKLFVIAQFRSLYTCSYCGRPGNHRRTNAGWRHTRCAEHLPDEPNVGRIVYDLISTPWRQMSDGKWRYDPLTDCLIRNR